jgi:sugar-specific transcriptional regulator TrmB
MITLDNTILSEIDRQGFVRKQEEKKTKFNYLKPKDLIVKSDKKGKIGKRLARKKQMHSAKLKELIQEQMKQKKTKQ